VVTAVLKRLTDDELQLQAHPNLNFWHVRVPTTPTVAAPATSKKKLSNNQSHFEAKSKTVTDQEIDVGL